MLATCWPVRNRTQLRATACSCVQIRKKIKVRRSYAMNVVARNVFGLHATTSQLKKCAQPAYSGSVRTITHAARTISQCYACSYDYGTQLIAVLSGTNGCFPLYCSAYDHTIQYACATNARSANRNKWCKVKKCLQYNTVTHYGNSEEEGRHELPKGCSAAGFSEKGPYTNRVNCVRNLQSTTCAK